MFTERPGDDGAAALEVAAIERALNAFGRDLGRAARTSRSNVYRSALHCQSPGRAWRPCRSGVKPHREDFLVVGRGLEGEVREVRALRSEQDHPVRGRVVGADRGGAEEEEREAGEGRKAKPHGETLLRPRGVSRAASLGDFVVRGC
jgi:hypothetical protein